MHAEAMPRGGGPFGFERCVAEPAEAFIVESHTEPPFPDDAVGEAARPMPAISAPQPGDQVEDTEDLGAVAHHLTVAGLAPAQDAVAVDDEGRAKRDVAVGVVHAVGADDRPVHVAQERELELAGLGILGVAEGTVAADRQDRPTPLADLVRDLAEAAELRRSDVAPVVAVEDQNDVAPSELRERDRPALRGGQAELLGGLGVLHHWVGDNSMIGHHENP
jgi:hypothetical protein